MRQRQINVIALMALTLWFATIATAEQINKCTDDAGKVIYQKEPCDKQQIEEKKDINPDRNIVQMELPPPSDTPQATPPTAAPPTTIIRRRGRY